MPFFIFCFTLTCKDEFASGWTLKFGGVKIGTKREDNDTIGLI